ncbi:MFS transporter [Vibrio ouci]|nr:MFS transporter [Vibrio ouci]
MLSLMKEYRLTYQESQWFINVFMVLYASFLPITGRLSDLFGRKRTFFIGLCLFFMGFVLGTLIESYQNIVISRGLCGIGAAAVTTSATSLLSTNIAEKNRKFSFSIFGTFLGVSMIVGPFLSSLLNDYSNGWIIYSTINLVILIPLLISSLFILERSKRESRAFDFCGSVLLTVVIFSLVSVASFFPVWGWDIKTKSICLLLSACLPLLFFAERKAVNPIVDLKLLSNKEFSSMSIISLLLGGGYISLMMYIPYILNKVTSLSAAQVGTVVMMSTLPSLMFPPLISKFRAQVNDNVLVAVTLMCLVISPLYLLAVISDASFVQLCFAMFFLGCSFGVSLSYLDGIAVSSVELEKSGLAAGTFNTFRIGGESIFIPLVSSFTAVFISKNVGIDIFYNERSEEFLSDKLQVLSSFSLILVITSLICFISSIPIMNRYRKLKS